MLKKSSITLSNGEVINLKNKTHQVLNDEILRLCNQYGYDRFQAKSEIALCLKELD